MLQIIAGCVRVTRFCEFSIQIENESMG